MKNPYLLRATRTPFICFRCGVFVSLLALALAVPFRHATAAGCAGTLDSSFKVPDSFPTLWSWYPPILAMKVQADGKVLIADGTFDYELQEVLYAPPIRFNTDGSLDTTYVPNPRDVSPHDHVVQADGKLLVLLPAADGAPAQLIRLYPDGARDTSFDAALPEDYQPTVIALQPDGKVLVGGGLVQVQQQGGVTKSWASQPVIRLLQNGALDPNFFTGLNLDTGPRSTYGSDSFVRDMVVDPVGRIYICGFFTRINELPRTDVARLNPDGTLDLSFEADIAVCTGCDIDAQDTVSALGLGPDGRLMIAGRFTRINGLPSHAVARLRTADADCAGVVSFAAERTVVSETNGFAVVTVLRLGGTDAPVTVGYRTYTNDHPQLAEATEFEDYPPGAGTLTFAPGETTKTFTIPIVDDALCEPNERIWVELQNPTGGAMLRAPTNAYVLVMDDEAAGRPGNVDVAFEPNIRVFSPWDGIKAVATDSQSIWVAGVFDQVDGIARNGFARLHADGRLDTDFNPTINGEVSVFAFDPAGERMLVGGSFTFIDGTLCHGLARFHSDGTLDTTFYPPSLGPITAISLQPDGKLLVAGSGVARLNPDGTSDPTFHNGGVATFDGRIYALASQPEGKVLVGGLFWNVEGQTVDDLARLNADGTLDDGFVPVSRTNSGFVNVSALAVQPDGRILVGGYFDILQGLHRVGLARLNPNGTIDASFNPGACGIIDSMVVQPDGKILIAADYWDQVLLPNRGVMRLTPDGLPDPSFFVAWVPPWFESRCLAVQSNGDVLIGGAFTEVNGLPRPGLARLHGDLTGGVPDTPGSITFSAPAYSVGENAGPAVVKVRRVWGSHGAISAAFRTRDETATTGMDYWATSGRVSFADGDTAEKTITISIFDDSLGETDESFELLLSDPTGGATLGSFAATRVTILDNEEVVEFPSPVAVVFATNQYARVYFTVTGKRDVPVTVELTTHDGSAKAGVDYEAYTETVILPGAGYGVSRSIHLLSNPAAQGIRTFTVSLRITAGTATLGPNSVATVYILDTQVPTGPGSIDVGFDPTLGGSFDGFKGDYPVVNTILLQPDGKALVGGRFDSFNGGPCRGLVRLTKDGSIDPFFNVPTWSPVNFWSGVNALALDPDGQIFVAFDRAIEVDGQQYGGVVRLKADGSFDPGFHTPTNIDYSFVNAVAVQKDGKVLLGGVIWSGADQPYSHLLRLKADGSLDRSFQPVPLFSDGEPRNAVNNILIDPDGRIILLGGFSTDMAPGSGLLRLFPDGTIDTNFLHGCTAWTESSDVLARQPDGKLIIGASLWDGTKGYGMVRLNDDGSIDTSFTPPAIEREVRSLALLPDGSLLVATNQWDRGGLMHLRADGSVDAGFQTQLAPSEGAFVSSIALLPNGQVLIGGRFGSVNGYPAQNIARLNTGITGVFVTRQLPYHGGVTVWLRSAPAPSTTAYAVQDQPPAGWQISNISDGGLFDSVTGQVKFGPFYDFQDRILHYDALPPSWEVHGLLGVFNFSGLSSADGQTRPIGGDSTITIAGLMPPDVNAADSRLVIDEVTAYGAAWRKGDVWPIPPNPIPVKYVTRAAALWRWGELYEVDRSVAVEPLWWVPSAFTLRPFPQRNDLGPLFCSAERQYPEAFVPGDPLGLSIRVSPGRQTAAYAVEEAVPAGWIVSAISDDGLWDSAHGKVKWGPFLDGNARLLSYTIASPRLGAGAVTFSGLASFDGIDLGLAGPATLREGCRLTVVSCSPSSSTKLALAGRIGGHFQIEGSTDLRTWGIVTTITNPGGEVEFSLPEVSEAPHRFYRARLVE